MNPKKQGFLLGGALVFVVVIAAFAPHLGGPISELNRELVETGNGDVTCNCLVYILPLIIGLGGIFGVVGLVLLGIKMRFNRGDDEPPV